MRTGGGTALCAKVFSVLIRLTQKLTAGKPFTATLSLAIDTRIKSRARVRLDDGRQAGLFLPRGTLLRHGDLLQSENGEVIKVLAASETVSTVYCDDALLLAKAAYHLGNRHVPLQIERNFLRYQHDHVLDDMLRQLGLPVAVEQASFEPEAGAYLQQSHTHGHRHQAEQG